jgi:integrase
MYVNQSLSILFYRKIKKMCSEGKVPLYVRVTIDGLKDEMSLGIKVHPDHWDENSKTVKSEEPGFRLFNKKIAQTRADLNRHFDLVQAALEIATPQLVLQSYRTPLSGERIKDEKIKNLALSEAIDTQIMAYIDYANKIEKAYRNGKMPAPEKLALLQAEKKGLDESIEKLTVQARTIFDSKSWAKTLVLAMDEEMLHFLQLASAGHRSPNTLEKMIGKKRRYIEFMTYRYKAIDMSLSKLDTKFLEELVTYLLVKKEVIQNTAMKYAQRLKEILNRAVNNGWATANVFKLFKCKYIDPEHDWLTIRELELLYGKDFQIKKLNIVKDIFLFCSFTGLSYAEVHSLKPEDIITGVDGKDWVTKDRQKTGGDETLPLLPIALELIEKYKNHKICNSRGKAFPVPSNQEYNRCLKSIARETGIKIVLRTHKARFYFANEVAYNNGVPLKTIARMLGQKSVRSAEIYVRANRKAISDSMENVQNKLFNPDGTLIVKNDPEPKNAKIIEMRAV